jgi:hypothetical protein
MTTVEPAEDDAFNTCSTAVREAAPAEDEVGPKTVALVMGMKRETDAERTHVRTDTRSTKRRLMSA